MSNGARVALEGVNYNPIWGLYNGACGNVKEIIFKDNENPNDGYMPLYVVVEFPGYTGPPWDIQNPTHVPIPMNRTLCNHGCCSRVRCPLVMAWAITLHRFQGQSAGPVDPGKIPNPYQCIVFDPHDSTAEHKALGLFYTGLSRATTLGGKTGIDSALFFDGKDATESRMQYLGQKVDSSDFYDTYEDRKSWINYLEGRVCTCNLTLAQRDSLLQWVALASYSPGAVEKRAILRQMASP